MVQHRRAKQRTTYTSSREIDHMYTTITGAAGRDDWESARRTPFPKSRIRSAAEFVRGERGGQHHLGHLHAQFRATDPILPKTAGPVPEISAEAILIVLLMHILNGEKTTFEHLAVTLAYRLDATDCEMIGIPFAPHYTVEQWHKRAQTAMQNLLAPLDPYPMPPSSFGRDVPRPTRSRRMSPEQRTLLQQYHAHLGEDVLGLREARLQDFTFALNANLMIRARDAGLIDTGDMAIDATSTPAQGGITNLDDLSVPAASTMPELLNWDKHLAKAFEIDLVVLTHGQRAGIDFILHSILHRPGETNRVPAQAFSRIERLGLAHGIVSADRLYNYMKTVNFHEVLVRFGYDAVFDYKEIDTGLIQDTYTVGGNTYILVDGTWYIEAMPEDLITCTRRALLPRGHLSYVDPGTLAKNIEARRAYQLTPHGTTPAGTPRYKLPKTDGYLAFDKYTGEIVDAPDAETVAIPREVGLKWTQRHPYRSPEWIAAYGLRSTVERANAVLKHGNYESIRNEHRRLGRGTARHAILIGLYVLSANVRLFEAYMRELEEPHQTRRRTRRKPADWDLEVGFRPIVSQPGEIGDELDEAA